MGDNATISELRARLAERDQEIAELRSQLAAGGQATLRAVIDNAPVAIVVTDVRARVLMTNPVADRLYVRPVPFGQDFESHVQMQLCHPDGTPYDPRDLPATRSALDGETFVGLDMMIRWPDGQERILLVNTAPYYDARGRIAGAVAAFLDITERKQMETEIRTAQAELEQRVRERTAALQESQAQLQALSRRVVESVENERRTIARELHDVSGQNLTAIQISLGVLQRHRDCSEDMRERLEDVKGQLDATMQELHKLTFDLRPLSLDKFGLHSALQQLLRDFGARCALATDITVVGLHEKDRLPSQVETVAYRIVQEALTNIARHAQARNVSTLLHRDDYRLRVMIEDDGRGFVVEEAQSRGRLGLLGMRERAEMIGGTLEVESTVGKGTTVVADLPLPVQDAEGA